MLTTFDTLKFARRLEGAGVYPKQATAFAEAAETLVATKSDIHRLDNKLDKVQGQVDLLKWMVGFNLAFTMAVVWRVFS